jgi:hypothetical protein
MWSSGPSIAQPNPTLAIPTDESATYGWQNYDQVGKGGRPVQLNDEGDPYTDREGEASDIHQFARTQYESPANFIEQYFPTKLLKDLQQAGQGDRSGSLSHLKYDGPSKPPAIIVRAGAARTTRRRTRDRRSRDRLQTPSSSAARSRSRATTTST